LATLALGVLASTSVFAEDAPLYKNAQAPLEKRVDDLLGRLTPEEKLKMLGGTGFTTQPIARLGVPPMTMADAGQGVRGGGAGNSGPATAFPAGVAMSSSWDTDLVSRIAKAIGEEARNKGTGTQMMLGPGVNIQRSPLGGRNGEYFSEDPFLSSRLAVSYIQGMQSTGIAACIKHFAANNQEASRRTINVQVGERALREIYLPTFEAGVKEGKVWSLMTSYNQVNGAHASANPYLLLDVLKKGWGFDGLVTSDWHGTHETAVMQKGNDLEMPRGEFNTVEKLQAALQNGSLTQASVDDSVRRILRTVIRVGLLDNPPAPNPANVNSPEHQAVAREAAVKGLVLLRNEGGILPLDRHKIHSIAVIGNAAQNMIVGALGSPEVKPFYTVQVLDGIRKQAGSDIAVSYAPSNDQVPVPTEAVTPPDGTGHGFKAQYFHGTELGGTPFLERVDADIQFQFDADPDLWPDVPATDFSVRWTGDLKAPATGTFHFTFTGDDGYRIKVNGKTYLDHWVKGKASTQEFAIDMTAGQTYSLEVEFFQSIGPAIARLSWLLPAENPFSTAVAAAKAADIAVVCVSTYHDEGEGRDRPSMELPSKQDQLIEAVAAANKNVIVVMNNGTPIAMKNWLKDAPGLVEMWYPGEEGGTALAAVLFGDANPSGKLPLTLGAERADYPDFGNFPGKDGVVKY
jgi:beta-glucosidase